MNQDELTHKILEVIVESDFQSISDVELSKTLRIDSSFIRQACLTLIDNDDVRDCRTKDGFSIGTKQATADAFYTKKYLTQPDVNNPSFNISATNVNIGDNHGTFTQSSGSDTHEGTTTAKKIGISIIVGIIVWLLTQFILLPILT
ncbi:hypothetical protein [Fulvivirga lutea]|uniref:Uncharacterized protein n=1 Tax=Fulvivirga lutea TaxID=2810512 RepID=A0A975A273_9BACT|nr:hypothetical protein [Fulvivirga lutea]QSE98995.1 hypothetical protein JR347_07890 [Fulvivirga lutea]